MLQSRACNTAPACAKLYMASHTSPAPAPLPPCSPVQYAQASHTSAPAQYCRLATQHPGMPCFGRPLERHRSYWPTVRCPTAGTDMVQVQTYGTHQLCYTTICYTTTRTPPSFVRAAGLIAASLAATRTRQSRPSCSSGRHAARPAPAFLSPLRTPHCSHRPYSTSCRARPNPGTHTPALVTVTCRHRAAATAMGNCTLPPPPSLLLLTPAAAAAAFLPPPRSSRASGHTPPPPFQYRFTW